VGFSGWTGFAIGLAMGLAVAAAVWHHKSRPPAEPAVAKQKKPEPASERDDSADKAPATASGVDFDFARKLREAEVVIPEKEKDLHHDAHAAPVVQPGTYYLQAGSYRGEPEADRVRAKLALAGIESKVQKVTIDADAWFRVRIGPYSDLDALNRVRTRLRQADIDAILIRVGGD
jgi:cell division protein FtsN